MNVPGLDLTQLAVNDVAHAMQLALGPVFLLNGVAVMLSMLTARLARVVDRARGIESRLADAGEAEGCEIRRVLAVTSRRARLINRAITLATVAALLVVAVVALLFFAAFVTFSIGPPIAVMFVTSMAALVGCLWCFLVEVRVATEALRFGSQQSTMSGQGED